ncbi:MAG: hypothetical protein JW776_03030 [Candidatus Lokiarchaeota archaeon]|nr:hypothetical protein [Candidatus Lokiarchaeota archaeon]
MGRKRRAIYEGYLTVADVRKADSKDSDIVQYWKRINHNIYLLGDVETETMIFLNRELKKLAERFEGVKVRITFEPLYGKMTQPRGKIPTPEEQYEGFELFKRRMFSLFKIS